MSKITLDNLSDNLKAYLEGLGLSEEQVLNLINENGLDEEELKAMLKDTMSINELATNSKTVIGAINELFQDVDNGKNLIATSIGNPLITGKSTFSAMSEAILGLRRESENETDAREVLYNMMIEDGYNSATSSMTVDELIDLLDRSGIELSDIKQIACAYQHTFILKKDGSLWATGDNASGQLGLGDNTDRKTFTKVTKNINKDVKQVACGQYYTFIIKNDGSIWSCGTGGDGQLGLGDDFSRNTFTKVTKNINNDVKQVACGSIFTFILKNDGSIWACGANGTGQLGFGNGNSRKTFLQVTTNINNDVKQVACGEYHTVILKNDGSVWSCGKNEFGQLGLNNTTKRTTFTQVTTNINNDVKEIACGNYHTFILKNDGSVWGCGNNEFGQLGLNDTTDKKTFTQVTTNINNDVKEIVCGGNYTVILKTTGSVWACGYNNYGQIGLNNTTKITTFTSTNFSTGLSEYDIDRIALYNYLLSNEIPVTEDMDIGTMLDLLVDDYINNMILGYENNLRIILQDEGVNLTEEDDMDSLITKVDEEFDKDNNIISEMEEEAENTRSTLAGLMQEGGYDITGNESMDRLLDLLELSGISVSDIKQIACGEYHTVILKNDGSVWSCGNNTDGRLGLGDDTRRTIFTQVTKNINNDVKQIACGSRQTFILKNDGSVWSCGNNNNGQLGLGTSDTNAHKTFTKVDSGVKQIACGSGHTFIVSNNGSVWACGYNGYGQLGLGDTNNRTTFSPVATNIINDVKQIACGYNHTVILKNDGSVWSCGNNNKGQLGLGNTNQRTSFTQVTTNINNDVKQIACSDYYTFILKNDGSVWSCGVNNYGQLGLGDTTDRETFTQVTENINNDVKQIACGGQQIFILKNDGSVWSCRTIFTQVTENISNDVKQIICGDDHVFILKNDGSVWGCGNNEFGQLGLNSTTNQSAFTMIPRGLY